ncbi:MAG: ABC transporter permease [Planctomycetes bacterium]|nr:ABC transporter permease [Planctomycetota bacterium]
MNVASISLRNLRVRKLSSALTAFSVALGTGLVAAIWLLLAQVEDRYKQSLAGYDAIVGPKQGSALQIVLSTVLNLDSAPGVVPLGVYRELREGALHKKYGVRYAIPQARGDSYGGFPVIGTTEEMFTQFARGRDAAGRPRTLEFARGKAWKFAHEDLLAFAEGYVAKRNDPDAASEHAHVHAPGEAAHDHAHDVLPAPWCKAVIGAEVARTLGLDVGGVIVPVHGQDEPGAHVHEEAQTDVVGVLAATGTPIDRSIFVPLSLFFSLDDHDPLQVAPGGEPDAKATIDQLLLSAIVLDARHPLAANWLRRDFQVRSDAQVAWPHIEVAKLLALVGNVADVLRIVAWLVIAVAAAGVLVALYNTMNERRREIAIMRALGARRGQILGIIVLEAAVVTALGALLGVLLCHGAAAALGEAIAARINVPVDPAAFAVEELWLILGVSLLGALAGLVPAIKGSTTEVAEHLGPIS